MAIDATDVAAIKAELRREARARRDGLTASERRDGAEAVRARLDEVAAFAEAGVIHVYIGVGSELDTRALILEALGRGVRVVAPRSLPGGVMEHREVASLEGLRPGPLGLLEPDPRVCPAVEIAEVDALIVPVLAFDREGYRLGQGGGYYDRLLATVSTPAIGIGFDAQLVDALPREAHDQRLDVVVTASETIVTGAAR